MHPQHRLDRRPEAGRGLDADGVGEAKRGDAVAETGVHSVAGIGQHRAIGLAQAQETTIGKAAAAVLVPAVVCCGLIVLAAVTFGVAAGIAGGMLGR